MSLDSSAIAAAAAAIRDADALLVGAGAGMGVDSGLPDFRGREGFWRAYPPYRKLGFGFVDMANPAAFSRDPRLGWGFYGHRLALYRKTVPHAGFQLLRRWGEAKELGCFVFTSNVDGQFQQAGFDPSGVVECHGSLRHLQCFEPCSDRIWSARDVEVAFDEATMRARPPLPECPACGSLARPNVLMFGDWGWSGERTHEQEQRYRHWLDTLRGARVAVVECGAGTAIPTVRYQCRSVANSPGRTLIRLNPRDPHDADVGIAAPALAALEAIAEALAE